MSSASSATGSYDFESLRDAEFQRERLRQQALAVRKLEADILRSAGLGLADDVLEVGSGPGFISDLLAELSPEGSLRAVDPSAELLSSVEGNVRAKPKRGLFAIQAFGDSLPVADASVDFAYARFVLQHLPDPAAVMAEIHRVLRPGGRFCAVDSDDGLVIFEPEDRRVLEIMNTAQRVQAEKGGDRFIGRKLQRFMAATGYVNAKSRVLAMTSSELPFSVLFNILLGYKASLLGGALDVGELYEDMSRKVATGAQLVAGGVFIVVGEKEV